MPENELRRGRAVARGEFVLDEVQAREKLREFQLVNPNYYILEFIKVAHLLEASAIEVEIDADEVELRFDGARFTAPQLDRLHSAPFSQRASAVDQALRHLAIGVHAAQGIGLGELRLEIGGEQPLAYRLEGEYVERLGDEAAASVATSSGTRIYLRERRRAGHLLGFVAGLRGRLPKVAILQERCGFTRVPLKVNGEFVNGHDVLDECVLVPEEVNEGGERIWAGITLLDQVVRTHLVHNGVLVSVNERPAAYFGARVVIDSPRLTLNLSQSAVVEDEEWTRIRSRVDELCLASLARYLSESNAQDLAAVKGWVVGVVFPLLQKRDLDEQHLDLAAVLEALPLFEAAHDAASSKQPGHWSIANARRGGIDGGATTLAYTRRSFGPGVFVEGTPVLVVPDDFKGSAQVFFGHFADEVVDWTLALELRELEVRNRRVWEQSPWPSRPTLNFPPHSQVARRVEGLDVCVTWRSVGAGVELCYVLDGRLLSRALKLDLGVDGLSIYISGEFETDATFKEAKRDARYEQLWAGIKDLLEESFSDLTGDKRREVILAIAAGRLTQGLNELAHVEHWTSGEYPLKALGPLADIGLFVDVDDKTWSLRALDEALATGRHQRILRTFRPNAGPGSDNRSDPRLAGELVLVLERADLKIVEALFGRNVQAVTDAFRGWEREESERRRVAREQRRDQERREEEAFRASIAREAERRRAALREREQASQAARSGERARRQRGQEPEADRQLPGQSPDSPDLESQMSVEFFEDIHGAQWSLEALHERAAVLRVLPGDARLPGLRADARLRNEAVLLVEGARTSLLHALFGSRLVYATDYLSRLARETELEAAAGSGSEYDEPFLVALSQQLKTIEDWRRLTWALHWGDDDAFLADALELLVERTTRGGSQAALEYAVARVEDPVALAFVNVALYEQLCRDEPRGTEVEAQDMRRFLNGLSAVLEAGH